ncbi:MAG: HAD family hydrolase [Propioniciclava sp.]|uniref:HAD family hydrolase n=1 Tax=Propioniciclava sp. TaxID=2038686 RepID=UPI0039E2D8D0
MKDIRLIASDMDHTLLTSSGEFPPGFHDLVARLNEAGITFVAASGRALIRLRRMFPQGGPGIAYIGDNGGAMVHDGEVLFTSVMDAARYREMVTRTLEATRGVPIVCGVGRVYTLAEYRGYEDAFRVFFGEVEFVGSLTDLDVDVVKFTAYFPGGDALRHRDEVFDPAYSEEFSITLGGPQWLDIMNPGVTKGSTLLRLADHLGLEPGQMMAFGDTFNDLEMLDAVRHSYAVANAHDVVRERARFLTGSNDEYGVVQVIDQVLAAKS